jgi:pimeloyl-ACP methyl ester carboxylesterase
VNPTTGSHTITVVAGYERTPPPRKQLRDNLPQAAVTVVPDSGHFPHLADPDRFAQLLADTAQW